MAGLMYEGSSLPPSVSQAAQNYMNYQRAIQNKLPLAVEGSAVPDSVRKAAQAAIERGAQAAPQAAGAAASAAGRGLLGTVARGALGIVGSGVMAAVEPGELGNGELSTEQRINNQPGIRDDAEAYAQRVQGNARQAAQQPPQGAGLLSTGVEVGTAPDDQPLDTTPVPQEQPQEAPQVAQEQQQRVVEAKRQTIQDGTLKGLQTGQVSVSELAGGVVEADAQRAGSQLTPVEKKKAVEAEVQAMKTMGKSDLSRYVSYALIAGGLLASVFDKSGKAGEAFSNSFNKQLDRNLAAGKMSQDFYNAQADRNLKERGEDRKAADSEVDAKYKGGLLAQGDRKIEQGDTSLQLKEKVIDQTGRIANADLGIKQQGVNLQGEKLRQSISNADRTYNLDVQKVGLMESNPQLDRESRERIAAQRAAAKAADAKATLQSGVPMSNKEAVSTVQTIAKERGDNISDAVAQSVAAYIPTAQKLNPGMSPNEIYEFAMQKQAGKMVQKDQYMGFGTPQLQIRKRKDDLKK